VASETVINPRDILKATEIALGALKTIQALTRVGPDKAQDALQTIAAIIVTVQDGLDGSTTPDVVEAELKALMNVENDDTAVADKFDNGDP
jgi:hypothetical protein